MEQLKLFHNASYFRRKDNIVYDKPEISAFEHFLGEFGGKHYQFHYYPTDSDDDGSPVSPEKVFKDSSSSSSEESEAQVPKETNQTETNNSPFAVGSSSKKKKKKYKYHSDFYLKLTGLNKKIDLYKKVFYTKKPKFLHDKESAKLDFKKL